LGAQSYRQLPLMRARAGKSKNKKTNINTANKKNIAKQNTNKQNNQTKN